MWGFWGGFLRGSDPRCAPPRPPRDPPGEHPAPGSGAGGLRTPNLEGAPQARGCAGRRYRGGVPVLGGPQRGAHLQVRDPQCSSGPPLTPNPSQCTQIPPWLPSFPLPCPMRSPRSPTAPPRTPLCPPNPLQFPPLTLVPPRAPLAAGPAVPLGVVPGPGSPAGIALDWIHGLLYWTEPSSGRVAVGDSSGTRHRTLHQDPRTRPWGVVVDPLNGYGGDGEGHSGGTVRGDRGLWGQGGLGQWQ